MQLCELLRLCKSDENGRIVLFISLRQQVICNFQRCIKAGEVSKILKHVRIYLGTSGCLAVIIFWVFIFVIIIYFDHFVGHSQCKKIIHVLYNYLLPKRSKAWVYKNPLIATHLGMWVSFRFDQEVNDRLIWMLQFKNVLYITINDV